MNSKTAIVFTGDIGFDRHMDKKWEDEQLLSQGILDFFHSADHVCINVEGAVIDAVNDGSKGVFFHSMHPEYAERTEKNWIRYRESEEYCEGAHMDYGFLRPVAEKAEDGTWQQSKLEKVKNYILHLLN